MINRKDFLALNFYAKSPFFGSYNNMHYRISKKVVEGEEEKNVFDVVYWPGPYALDKTSDNLKQYAQFEFSEEGLTAVAEFLNEQYNRQKELWQSVIIY